MERTATAYRKTKRQSAKHATAAHARTLLMGLNAQRAEQAARATAVAIAKQHRAAAPTIAAAEHAKRATATPANQPALSPAVQRQTAKQASVTQVELAKSSALTSSLA